MKTPPALLPILRSPLQGEMLSRLLLHPDGEYTLSELAAAFGVSVTAVMREADRLVEAGIAQERRAGRTRLIRARPDTPVYRPLADLMAATFGPLPVVAEELAGLDGVNQAFIYGSWAARHEGSPGPPPADVDVLIVGQPDRDDLFDRMERASGRLARPVNAHRVSDAAWSGPADDPFIAAVKAGPIVRLPVGEKAR
ncbi:MAG: winged helix-turn-helix domain-containing protein [Bifidobacteriaceae bacterium]|jgi:DNA-binding transcriptional ArsR family regulator|nr:winged helix-turn-helix domain-containing protein [Bifidobacteriaceae bacterium]